MVGEVTEAEPDWRTLYDRHLDAIGHAIFLLGIGELEPALAELRRAERLRTALLARESALFDEIEASVE